MPADAEFLYDAFISYRHTQFDRSWAQWLHKRLEKFRTPRSLVAKGVRKKLLPIFRDDEELSAAADLNESVRAALQRSRILIIVCSPESAASPWVNAELAEFQRLGRGAFVRLLLIRGEPEVAFPPSLLASAASTPLDAQSGVPLAADVRGESARSNRGRNRLALFRLVAPILGCSFDELRQRHQEAARQRNRLLGTGLALLAVIGLGAAGLFIQRQIFGLVVHARDGMPPQAMSPAHDVDRALLLGRLAFERSRSFAGIGAEHARDVLERAVIQNRLRGVFDLEGGGVRGLAWHESGTLAAGDDRGQVTVWDPARPGQQRTQDFDTRIDSLAFRPGSPAIVLAIGDSSRVIKTWSLADDVVMAYPTGNAVITQYPSSVSWCAQRDLIAGSDGLNKVLIWKAGVAESFRSFVPDSEGALSALAWNGDCSALAIGSSNGRFVWRADDGMLLRAGRHVPNAKNVTQARAEGALSVAWSDEPISGPKFVSGGEDGATIESSVGYYDGVQRVWHAADDLFALVHGYQDGPVPSVAWSPNGQNIASASLDGTVRIWTGSEWSFRSSFAEFATNQNGTLSVAWSPDGNEVATGGRDGTVKIWRVSAATEVVKLAGKDVKIAQLYEEAERGGRLRLLIDGALISDAQLIELARVRSFRTLTAQECSSYLQWMSCPD